MFAMSIAYKSLIMSEGGSSAMEKKIAQGAAPLFQALVDYHNRNTSRFHVPGHKGYLFPSQAKPFFEAIATLDVTELSGLDDLHGATGVIMEAQKRAAETFFAEHTYFLVNGSTVGNLALILSVIQKGDTILVQRNAHKSVFHALALAEAQAVFIQPELCPTLGVPIGITPYALRAALDTYPTAKALFLTAPNYYGQRLDSAREIIELAHKYQLIVLVDEAHGAHFGQHKSLPSSAMQLGADAVVQSTHKMLSGMTMSAMLHIQGKRVAQSDLENTLQMLQSSSPSYVLMASLDLARAYVDQMTSDMWQEGLEANQRLAKAVEAMGYHVSKSTQEVKNMQSYSSNGVEQDPYKLVIQASFCTGFELQAVLESEGIFSELADPLNVVLTLPLQPNEAWNRKLLTSLEHIRYSTKASGAYQPTYIPESAYPEVVSEAVQMRVVKEAEQEESILDVAIGKRAAEAIVPYPPGIPLCFVNQVITAEHIKQIRYYEESGARIQGKALPLQSIKVIRSS